MAHVERLFGMVSRHLVPPFRFTCVNDSPFPGWWAKTSLFEPGRFKGRVLYLDLDVTVVGDLMPLARYPSSFVAIRDFLMPATLNSSVMAWDAGVADHIHTVFTPDVMKRLHGDQDWITEVMPDAARFPRSWCLSYKQQVRLRGPAPKDTKVIVYHGAPKPWDLPDNHLDLRNHAA